MVERIGKLLAQKVSGVHMAAYILGFFTILSSLLALMRDRLLAAIFGAGIELDMYYAAFRIPDLLFVSVGSLVSISVLIPLLAQSKDAQSEQEELSKALTFFVWCMLGITIATWFLLPQLSAKIFTGFAPGELRLLVVISRILLLSPILLGLSNIFGSVAQISGRFVLYAISPILYNMGIIGGILFLAPQFGIVGVAYGVVVGAIFHVLPQALYVYKKRVWPRLVPVSLSYIKKLSVLSVGRTVALSLSHIVLLILVSFASLLSVGSISVFTFSYNLQSVVVGVFGVSYSLAAFSALSRLAADGQWKAYAHELTGTVRQLVFWSMPAVVLLIILRAQIVRTVLGAGAFTWEDTRLTAAVLAIFAFSTVFQSLSLIFTRAYYAQGKTRIPLVSYVVGGISTIVIAWYMMSRAASSQFVYMVAEMLKVSDLDFNVIILPFAFTVGMIVTSILLYIPLVRMKLVRVSARFVTEIVSASLVIGAVAYGGLALFDPIFGTATLVGIFLQGLCAGLLGISMGALVLYIFKNSDIHELVVFVRKKQKVVVRERISPEVTDMAP